MILIATVQFGAFNNVTIVGLSGGVLCFTLEISYEIKTLEREGVVRKKTSKKTQNASMTLLLLKGHIDKDL